MPFYHTLTAQQVLDKLHTSRAGLSSEEVIIRRGNSGWNELPAQQSRSWLFLLLKQFKNLMVVILVVAAIISLLTGHIIDVYVIFAVILINVLIGFIQELRAEKSVESLRKMLVQQAQVIRDGERKVVASRELVPGDIIILEEGEVIPADARILDAYSLRINEAPLTGESVPVGKDLGQLPPETLFADQKNMLWKGTYVSGGQTTAVVCYTGMETAIGDIALTLSQIKPEKTNFQVKTDRLARQMAAIALGSTLLFFGVAYFGSALEMEELLLTTIAVLVSAIPEGLPAVLSIVLAIGSYRMSKQHAIVKEFSSVETLGAVTAIITDKTGTLTQNTLTVKKIMILEDGEFEVSGEGWSPVGNFSLNQQVVDPLGFPGLAKMLRATANSNNAVIKYDSEKKSPFLAGDPTEGALLVLSKKAGIEKGGGFERFDDLPFDSHLKLRASLCGSSMVRELFVLGAPERLLEESSYIMGREGPRDISAEETALVREKIDCWSRDAMRVIGVAYKPMDKSIAKIADNVSGLVWLGIVGMVDPPRPEAKQAIEKCHRAGIRVIMATGDHINTAIAIAKATGIISSHQKDRVLALTEQQLLQLDDVEFEEAIKKVNVFSRLSPRMKLRIAERLQQAGELIAMTGDGVNDAPALKKADIGIAMGVMGTDVSRDAADLVLADDNFATIVHAVEVGRVVFANARKTSFFLITTNFAEIGTLISMLILGYPMPLTAIQILWLNLVTDGVGDIALATEEGHGDELDKKPIGRKEGLLNKEIMPFLIIMPLCMVMACIGVFLWFYGEGLSKARTAVFITMATTQLFNLFNMRSLSYSIVEIGIFSNIYVTLAFFSSLAIQVIITEIPFFQTIFSFESLSLTEVIVLIVISSVVLWAGEIYKYMTKKIKYGAYKMQTS